MSVTIGANALSQLVCFLLCVLFGMSGGIFSLLYFLKCGFFERLLLDLFATVCIGGIFIAATEWAMDGQVRFYGIAGYVVGMILTVSAHRLIKKIMDKRRGK